jgi:putative transcriptional regulator
MLRAVSDLAPGFLIAVPQMEDPNFARSVVLLIEHGTDGAMGIIFNRRSEVRLADVGKSHELVVSDEAGCAFVGGPVQRDRGFLLHRKAGAPDSIEVTDGIYLSVSTDCLKPLLEGDPHLYRLCLGYAGWGPGQLEREVMVGGWLTGKATAERVFDTSPDKVWDLAIRDLGVDPAFLVPAGGRQ